MMCLSEIASFLFDQVICLDQKLPKGGIAQWPFADLRYLSPHYSPSQKGNPLLFLSGSWSYPGFYNGHQFL